jgi:hypothetical protein
VASDEIRIPNTLIDKKKDMNIQTYTQIHQIVGALYLAVIDIGWLFKEVVPFLDLHEYEVKELAILANSNGANRLRDAFFMYMLLNSVSSDEVLLNAINNKIHSIVYNKQTV